MVILDKIINDLKAKLPFLKKPETEGDELEENVEADESSRDDDVTGATNLSEIEETDEGEEEAVASNASLIHKLKAKIQSLSKKPASKSKAVEEAPAEDDEAAKKKKRSRIIQAVIGLGLIAFLAEDYIVPKEEPIEAPVAPPVSRRKTPPADTTATTPSEVPPTDTAATTPSEVQPTDTTATTPSEVPPTETTPTETTPAETVATEPSTTTETLPDSPVDVTSTEVPSEPSTDTPDSISTAPTEEPVPDTTDTTITDTPTETTPPTSMDTIDGETVTSDDNLTDQILQDLEKQAKDTQPKETVKQYVAPPDYEYRGRGLVYNCTGKHWACVDAPSFKICEDNASSTKFLNKTMECHPVNVYETQKGCENIQNRMVSSSTKTTFCN